MEYTRESWEHVNTVCSDRVMCLVGLKDCPRELEICSVRDGDRVNHTCILELYFEFSAILSMTGASRDGTDSEVLG